MVSNAHIQSHRGAADVSGIGNGRASASLVGQAGSFSEKKQKQGLFWEMQKAPLIKERYFSVRSIKLAIQLAR